MQKGLINKGAVLHCRLVQNNCPHSFPANEAQMTAFQQAKCAQQAKDIRAPRPLAKVTKKTAKRQFTLLARRGLTNVQEL
jgi:hypothetical protein